MLLTPPCSHPDFDSTGLPPPAATVPPAAISEVTYKRVPSGESIMPAMAFPPVAICPIRVVPEVKFPPLSR